MQVLAAYLFLLLLLKTQLLMTTEMELKIPPLQLQDLALEQQQAINDAMALPVRWYGTALCGSFLRFLSQLTCDYFAPQALSLSSITERDWICAQTIHPSHVRHQAAIEKAALQRASACANVTRH